MWVAASLGATSLRPFGRSIGSSNGVDQGSGLRLLADLRLEVDPKSLRSLGDYLRRPVKAGSQGFKAHAVGDESDQFAI
jgi:hypothetical protein